MKYILLLGLSILLNSTGTRASGVHIPDANFKTFLLEDRQINTNGDGEISISEAQAVEVIVCENKNIADFTGIEAFTKLTTLICNNNPAKTLDLSKNTALTHLECLNLNLTSLDLSKNTALKKLHCHGNKLTSLDLSSNTLLKSLSCSKNQISRLDLSANGRLEELQCNKNLLTSLDVSKNLLLKKLRCGENKFTTVHLKANKNLKSFTCNKGKISTLDLSSNTKLKELNCSYNPLKVLDLSNLKSLKKVVCTNNQLNTIKLNSCTALTSIKCNKNKLTALDLSSCSALEYLYCENNQLAAIHTEQLPQLRTLACSHNKLKALDLSKSVSLSSLKCSYNELKLLDARPARVLKTLKCAQNNLEHLNIKSLPLKDFTAKRNDKLKCIETDNPKEDAHTWRYTIEEHMKFSEDCGYKWETNTQKTNTPTELSVTKGLIAHYPFDGSANDISSFKNNGQLDGSPSYTQNKDKQANGAIAFYHGSSKKSSLTVNDPKGFNENQLTVSFWYKSEKASADISGGVITQAYKSRYANLFQVSHLYNAHDQKKGLKKFVGIKLSMKDANGKLMSLRAETDNNWHHVAFTMKASGQVNLYLDGKLSDSRALTAAKLTAIPSTLMISYVPQSGDPNANTVGPIDDYRIYNRELSQQEVKMIYELSIESQASQEGNELNDADKGLNDLVPPPPPEEDENPDDRLSELVPLPPMDEDEPGVSFNPENNTFIRRYEGNNYKFQLPSKLKYQNHTSNEKNTVIAYELISKNDNYLGIWNTQLEYQYEYNFQKIEIASFIIEEGKAYGDGLIMVYYKDLPHNTQFIGLFDEKMTYIGQYEVSGATNVSLSFAGNNPTIEYTYKKKKWVLTLDRKAKKLKKNEKG